MIGNSLSHYQITAELGRGGMGIVYKARDTKLDREVAIKVLPSAALASDDDRERFYREAKSAAALNHPNIAQVYQIDEAVPSDAPHGTQPSPFIAMEFIDGATLEDRIKEGPLKLEEAMSLAIDLADALGAAHAKNIVHRDIKSANIMLTALGKAKVLDFGLALTSQSTKLTRMGSTLGTVAYMSPEQARGEEVDHRTDLWALGVVIYEMITGSNPFGGDYEQAVVYSILNEDPEPVTALRTGVPMELEQVIDKCLRKEADHRYQSAAGLIADLKALNMAGGSGSRTVSRTTTRTTSQIPLPSETSAPSASATTKRSTLAPVIGIAGVFLGALLTWMLLSQGSTHIAPSTEIVRSSILLPADRPYVMTGPSAQGLEKNAIALSPDGSKLVYRTLMGDGLGLAMRDQETGVVSLIPETEGGSNPVFSPDGSSIAYETAGELYRIPVEGGRPRFVANVADPTGIVWANDGNIYFANYQGNILYRATPEGELTELTAGERCNCGMPTRGPNGEDVVLSGRDEEVTMRWTKSKGLEPLTIAGNHVTYVQGDRALFTRTGQLLATNIDPDTGNGVGEEAVVLDDLRTGSILRSGHYALSGNGTLYYVSGLPSGLVDIIIRNSDGTEEEVGLPSGVYGPVDVSPDERYIIIRNYDRGGQQIIFDRQNGSQRVLPGGVDATDAVWGNDSQTLFLARPTGESHEVIRIDLASGAEEILFSLEGDWASGGAVSPDGRHVAYRVARGSDRQLWVYDLVEETIYQVAGGGDGTHWKPDWSRDGRFFTYTRVSDGGSRIYVEPFPPDGRFSMISPNGGEQSEMLQDEDALVYRQGQQWMKVTYGETLDSFSEPKVFFEGPYVNVAGMEYRALQEGKTILQRPLNLEMVATSLEVITGFDALLSERLDQ